MATPNPYIPALLDYAGLTIRNYVFENVPTNSRILDVGAGWGKYRFLLPEYEMDCVEVWQPYVMQNHLDAYYHKVYIENIIGFTFKERYGAIVMGDVLEHIPKKEAWGVVEKLCNNADFVCIAVPFEMEQEAVEGNSHEEHVQPDLNEQIMAERFPQLELLEMRQAPGEHAKAIYVKRGSR